MSGSNYDMSSTWNQPQLAPQLENEYEMDPSLFNPAHNETGADRAVGRQGATPSQHTGFSTYSQSFAGDPQHAFNFNDQQPQGIAQQFGNDGYFPNQSHTPNRTQRLRQQQQFMFNPASTSTQQGQPGMRADMYSGNARNYTYPQQSHQGTDVRMGPGQGVIGGHIAPRNTAPAELHNGGVYVSPPAGYTPPMYVSSPPADMPIGQSNSHPQVAQYYAHEPQPAPNTSPLVPDMAGAHPPKRLRPSDDIGLGPDGEGGYDEGDGQWDQRDTLGRGDLSRAAKQQGACGRCKGLKVKCEFKTDPDICKRCLNGHHECVIPGRKKRRAPPKREHLLKQITEQAAQINKLMVQLEKANRRSEHAAQDAPSPTQSSSTTDMHSSISLSSLSNSRITSPDIDTTVTKPDVQDWIAKARESIEAFGGYISMGGPSATREMLAQSDGTDEFEFAVEADAGEDDWDGATEGEGALSEQYQSGDDSSVATTSRRPRLLTPNTSERRRRPSAPSTDRLATIPNEAAPFGLMAGLSLKKSRRRRHSRSRSEVGEDEEEEEVGLANDDYFKPSFAPERPLISEQHQQPHILRSGIVSPAEVESLFKIYWDYMNLSVSLLDPELYTAQKTYWRSPFLFTVICAIASRYYAPRPTLYQQAMHYAQLAAGTTLIGGQKNVEAVHAYILLALYPVPSRRWEDDRSWVYLGLAIRIATDLNLHHPNTAKPRNEQHGREMLNRTRVWLNCFNLDRSTGSQYGKMPIIQNSDFTANRSGEWWNSSLYNMPNFDIHIAAYNAELTLLGRFRGKIYSDPDNPTGYNKSLDLGKLASETDDELARLWETWRARVHKYSDQNDPQCRFRTGLLRLAYSYARLTALSFGFQFAFGKSNSGADIALLWRCLRAATDTVRAMVDEIGVPSQRIYLRHGPEAQSVFVTFASAFLIKLLQPKYSAYFTREQRLEIRDLVQRVVDLLGSTEVAIDDRHGPKLYSQFLKGLLATPMAQVDHTSYVLKREPVVRQPTSKSKSASPPPSQVVELHYDTQSIKCTSTPSSVRLSQSPLPTQSTLNQIDQYGQIMQSTQPSELMPELPVVSEFFAPPLPFDELLHLDPSVWPDMAMPGFAWMGGLNPTDADANMTFDPMAMPMGLGRMDQSR